MVFVYFLPQYSDFDHSAIAPPAHYYLKLHSSQIFIARLCGQIYSSDFRNSFPKWEQIDKKIAAQKNQLFVECLEFERPQLSQNKKAIIDSS